MDAIETLARALDDAVPPGHWHQSIFSYCERGTDAQFWAEPINAVTNGAFYVAALAALFLWLRGAGGQRRIVDLVLIVLVFVIGTGSFLFHTLANRWSAISDTAPIGLFMLLYFGYVLNRFFRLNWFLSLLGMALFAGIIWQTLTLRCGNGPCWSASVGYLPALVALLGLGLALAWKRHPAWRPIFFGGVVFALSLTLRSVDRSLCASTYLQGYGRVGTHFMWHVLNATLLYLLLRAAVLYGGTKDVDERKSTV
ncbi:ceramidase domain-containing protein [Filomicrobium sp.]|uniref:ceramidase domain-containing protein n=1 Tax=Filomicrobium sp. TaxID=2024831 RepID=UPI00258F3D85|nr:ceramidase domain-containing protein [Filomicrobium sp.]MCV0369077.1 ceramidase domain-containing protein [Filomicrobium sp.]